MADFDIFIVSPPKNQIKVNQLKNELIEYGYSIREVPMQFVFGTSEWDSALTNELKQCTFVIYAASPLTKLSRSAVQEIKTAREMEIPVLLYWVQGYKWGLSAPSGFDTTLYIDARSETQTELVVDAFEKYTLLKQIEANSPEAPNQLDNQQASKKRAKPKTRKVQVMKVAVKNFSAFPNILQSKQKINSKKQKPLNPNLSYQFASKFDPKYWIFSISGIAIALLIILILIAVYIFQVHSGN